MDPYLEQHWGDVHTSLMVYARNQINPQLPDDLQARVEESATVQIDQESIRTLYPDVRVVEEPDVPPSDSPTATAVLPLAEPLVLTIEDEPRTERHIEIIDTSDGGRVVTAIEVLSPANKVGNEGRIAYVRKQREYLLAGVNLVEIDLIREGDFVLAAPESRIPADFRTPYLICIRRAKSPGRVELYRAPLRERLPNIPIPLRASDEDIVLQIQPLIDECYRDGRYHRLNYEVEPTPRLGEGDAVWADSLLRQNGRR
jgi:hypothetical protein